MAAGSQIFSLLVRLVLFLAKGWNSLALVSDGLALPQPLALDMISHMGGLGWEE